MRKTLTFVVIVAAFVAGTPSICSAEEQPSTEVPAQNFQVLWQELAGSGTDWRDASYQSIDAVIAQAKGFAESKQHVPAKPADAEQITITQP